MKIHNPHTTPQILPQPPGSKKNACPSNPLNLPTSINFYSKDQKIDYIYTATGQKTQQKTIDDGRVENRRQYAGSFVFKNRQLSYAASIAGRFLYLDLGRGNYDFENEIALKDHLGNTRVTLDEHGNSTQQIDYYPFGHMIYESDTETPFAEDNRYLYNGKELQDDFGLEWYDYVWRMYDPAIARWHVIDPAIEENHHEWTPYAYVYNNPLRLLDLFGLDSLDAVALTQAAENAVVHIEDNYGSTSAQCNRGVTKAFKELTGKEKFDGKLANDMVEEMEGSEDFKEVEVDDVQDEANDGSIIIAGKKDSEGHVALAVPGEEASSGNWGGSAPVGMDTGEKKRWSKKGMNYSWSSKTGVKFYKYTGVSEGTINNRTYSGGTIKTVTVRAQRNGNTYLKPKPAVVTVKTP